MPTWVTATVAFLSGYGFAILLMALIALFESAADAICGEETRYE